MIFRFTKYALTIVAVSLLSSAFTQEIVSDSLGNKIRLEKDHTWSYILPEATLLDCSKLATEEYSSHGGTSVASIKMIPIFHEKRRGYLPFITRKGDKVDGYNLTVFFSGIRMRQCMDKNVRLNISFYDHTTLKLRNQENHNCKGDFKIVLAGGVTALNQLLTKRVKKIEVHTSKEFVNVVFNNEQSELLRQSISCVFNY